MVYDFTHDGLRQIAEELLAGELDPVPRLLLLRDVLGVSGDDPRLSSARHAVRQSRWVQLLEQTQLADGTWGRFHSQDTSAKQRVPTTETAVAIALASGLDGSDPVLERLMPTLLEYVEGRSVWCDRPEKHDNPDAWWIWVRHFSAATLSQIDPAHPALGSYCRIWAEVVEASFQDGRYDCDAEIVALNRLLQCRMRDPMPFHTKPALLLLSAERCRLQPSCEHALLQHVVNSDSGIYYVCDHRLSDMPGFSDRRYWNWTRAHRLLSRFRLWRHLCVDAANWIWAQRSEDGLWDLGRNVGRKPFTSMPLSESWRRKDNRLIDSTTEMLAILARVFN
jgi:hypothetical protein